MVELNWGQWVAKSLQSKKWQLNDIREGEHFDSFHVINQAKKKKKECGQLRLVAEENEAQRQQEPAYDLKGMYKETVSIRHIWG